MTNPGLKKLYRIYQQGKIKADLITLADETLDSGKELLLMDETHDWKKTVLYPGTYTLREMLIPVFQNGNCVYNQPSLLEIKAYAQMEMETLWDEHKRLTNPEQMRVDLSDNLLALKKQLLYEAKQEW